MRRLDEADKTVRPHRRKMAHLLVMSIEAATYDMNTAIEQFCPDPIVVKCPICWNQFPFSTGWLRAVTLAKCPKCTVVIRVKAPAQRSEFNRISPNPPNSIGRLDASSQNP